MPSIRIADVARRAGVSTTTVSHVLNETRSVAQETRRRVLAAAQDLGYSPSAVARGLRTKSTGSIGIIVSDVTNPFSTTIVRGIEDVASEAGTNVILCNSDENEHKAATYLRLLLGKRIDGLILAPTGNLAPLLTPFQATGVPIVTVDRRLPGGHIPFVGIDNVSSARRAVAHLLDDGHVRVGVIAGLEAVSTSVERLEGYGQALAERGIPFDPQFVRKGYSSIEGGRRGARELLLLDPRPTALFTTNNFMTLGALKAIRELGVACPDQVAIFGFDDHDWAVIFSPAVSVVRQPIYDIGARAAQMLLRAIQGQAPENCNVLLKTTLVIRGSCRPGGHDTEETLLGEASAPAEWRGSSGR